MSPCLQVFLDPQMIAYLLFWSIIGGLIGRTIGTWQQHRAKKAWEKELAELEGDVSGSNK